MADNCFEAFEVFPPCQRFAIADNETLPLNALTIQSQDDGVNHICYVNHISDALSLIHQNYVPPPHHINECMAPPAWGGPVNICRLQNDHFNRVLFLQYLFFDLNFGVG